MVLFHDPLIFQSESYIFVLALLKEQLIIITDMRNFKNYFKKFESKDKNISHYMCKCGETKALIKRLYTFNESLFGPMRDVKIYRLFVMMLSDSEEILF